jgi:hypothetical protein
MRAAWAAWGRVLTRTGGVAKIQIRAQPCRLAALLNSAMEAPVRTTSKVLAGGCVSAAGMN